MSGFWSTWWATRSFRYAFRWCILGAPLQLLAQWRCPHRQYHAVTSCGCCHTCGFTREVTT